MGTTERLYIQYMKLLKEHFKFIELFLLGAKLYRIKTNDHSCNHFLHVYFLFSLQ